MHLRDGERKFVKLQPAELTTKKHCHHSTQHGRLDSIQEPSVPRVKEYSGKAEQTAPPSVTRGVSRLTGDCARLRYGLLLLAFSFSQ